MEHNMKLSLICGAVVAFAALTPVGASADSPRHFLHDAIAGDNSEIALGNMAQEHAASGQVRDFGRTLSTDHSQARDHAQALADHMGIGRVRGMTPEAQRERDRLFGLHGRDFDREFVRYMIDDHRQDIAKFRDEAREHHGPVSQLARQQLPTLQKHLDMALAIQAHDDDRMADRNNGRGRWDHR
jgi:putative membrane protein